MHTYRTESFAPTTYVRPTTNETSEESTSRPHEKNKVSDGGRMMVSMVDSDIHNEKEGRPFEVIESGRSVTG